MRFPTNSLYEALAFEDYLGLLPFIRHHITKLAYLRESDLSPYVTSPELVNHSLSRGRCCISMLQVQAKSHRVMLAAD